ncbi:hypothetical protein [Noviherbaspirillum cavernae]|nr:hypothetical protein [Noviherbaspirillum cavernae]
MSERLTDLKNVLLTLKAAGAAGFEGFVRIALTALTDIPFRLAASGLQGGMDGDATLRSDAVSFEAKRYSGDIPRNEVLTKIVDLARNKDAPDRLWVLGATTEVSAQLASAMREAGDQYAISTLILDWSTDPLPLLALAIVAAGDPAINFLTAHCDPKPDRTKLAQAFEDISKHPDFDSLLQKLRSSLNISTLAMARSIEVNAAWRAVSFGSENAARERLGQTLAVTAQPELPPLRAAQRDQVKKSLQAGQSIILAGEEGHGKSWLAAQICCDHEGIALFASAEQFDSVAPQALDEYLIDLLIKQTSDVSDEAIRLKWRHRLAAWQNQPPASSLLVVIDGINQRQNFRWDRLLNGFQERLQAIGGRLVVTVRPQFWQKTVAPGLTFKPKLIDVPEWSPDERNELLQHYGISLDWLDEATLRTLSNPRLLGVAVTTLPHRNSTAWKGLTTDRILMEHLRASQRENFEEETLAELTKRLSNHAKEVLERVRASSDEPSQNFEADSTAVIETRFFRTLPGPGETYELRSEGLTLALGYTLIDQLWQARRSDLDLGERMTHLIDPIYAMDRTVDVMFAALMVCALDPIRFDQTIFAALLDAFSNLQNINDQRFEEFVGIVKNQPTELFSALGVFTLERGRRFNQDWFIHAAFEIAATDEGWPAAETAIHHWLHCYNKDAVEQTNRYPKHNEDEDAKRLEKAQKEIQDVLLSLSPFERNLLEQMTEVAGETDSLFTLALQLLAGRPLAGFASSFIALGLGFSLDSSTWSARKAFQQLTTFNRADREPAKEAFLKAIEPLRSSNTSQAGQWTVVRMLYATGDEAAASEASAIAQKLREDWFHWKPSPDEWRKSRVADPNATRPVDIDTGLSNFCAIRLDSVLQSMEQRKEDHDLGQFFPVACRFEPEVATEKARQILSSLLTRTAFPLRQLIFNGTEYAPLLTRDIAVQLITRVTDTDMVQTLSEQEQNVLRMFLFSYVVPHLTPAEQLDCMIDPAFGTDYLLEVIPSLKSQPTEAILDALQAALDAKNEGAAYGALAAARYGNTPITTELESLILRCRSAESSKLRSLSFGLAIHGDLKTLRDAHVQSDWSACATDTRTYESWFGSMLLAEACAKNELAIDEMLKRINPKTWFAAAERVGEAIIKPLADHFLHCLQGAIGATKNLAPPAADFTLSTVESAPYPFLSVDETDRDDGRFPRQKTLKEMFGKDDDFYEKQDRLRAISDAFFEGLKGSDARLLAECMTIDDLGLLVRADTMVLPQILEILEQASSTELIWLKNLAFVVANLVSKDMPERAVTLFEKALTTQGFVTYALEDDLTLEHEAIWSSAPSEAMSTLWRQRLLKSGNDEALAREVVAAERFGAATFIRDFVEEQADSASTLDQAYAISVAGFSTQAEQLVGVIEDHLDDNGITGDAAKKAKAAHEAAQWSRKWVNDMCAAQSPEEFLRCLIISKTCMDARASAKPILGIRWAHYAPLFRKVRKAAIKEQNKTRKNTFLGREAPDGIFVTGY